LYWGRREEHFVRMFPSCNPLVLVVRETERGGGGRGV
jgi:hypothetical protein